MEFDWVDTIRLNLLKLKAVGLWPKEDDYKFDFYTLWATISVVCIIFAHNFFQVVSIFLTMDDLKAVTATAFVNLPELLGMLKTYNMIQNMGILKKLVHNLSSPSFQPRNERQKELVQPNLKLYKSIYKVYWTMCCGALFFWAVFPILDNSVKDYRLPFMAWYPFNTMATPNYEITYIYQIVGITFVAVSTVGIDTLIAALNMYASAQIDILCDNLKHLNMPDFQREFLKCMEHHREILRFVDNVNSFFKWIVFLQFFISAVSIGITMFQMTVVVPFSSEFFSTLSFELAIVVEIFMYCWFGNEVQEKSKQIPYAIFQSGWIDAPIEVKKTMYIFVMKCQKPIRLSAFNLFYLSIETFMTILRASWSYFALLHQVTSRK